MREIRIYGKLAKFLKRRVFRAEVANAAEAIRFLLANFPQLESHMLEQHYRVSLGDDALTLDELHHPAGRQAIKIVPVMSGAGKVGEILAGVALIALTIATGGFGGAAIGLFGAGTIGVGTLAFGVGAALVLGGVSQLLSPKTPAPNNDPSRNYYFSGIQNTSRQGLPVPIIYGEVITGSIVISAGVDVDQVAS
jgi:predicted phage tail protein